MIQYEHWKVRAEAEGNGTKWQILGYPEIVSLVPSGFDASKILASGIDLGDAMRQSVTPLGHAPIHPVYPRQHVRIIMDNSSVLLEPGAMHFTRGQITMGLDSVADAGGVGGFLKKAVTSIASGESMVKPRFKGTGELFLEPRTDHIFLIPLNNETFVCDQGLWVACDGSMEVDGQVNSFSAAMAGGEGMVMPRAKGTGVVMLQSPVPKEKILEIKLNNEELRVDGPFVMASWGNLEFTCEKSGSGILSSAASGEGLVNVYKGTGTVWMNLQEAGCFA